MLSEHEASDRITVYGAVESVTQREAKGGKPFVVVMLSAEGKTAKCFRWNMDKKRLGIRAKDIVKVDGKVDVYAKDNSRSLIIDKINVVKKPTQELLNKILPSMSSADQEFYFKKLKKFIALIKDKEYKLIVRTVMNKYHTSFVKGTAAKSNHDAFIGGLLKHTVNVTSIARAIAKHYGEAVSMDLVLAGAILHDLGKIASYDIGIAQIDYSTEGTLIDHVFHTLFLVNHALGNLKVNDEKLMLIKHIVVSHHGRREWGALNEPSIEEAWIVHLADMADCHVAMTQDALRDVEPGQLTPEKVWPYGRKMYRKAEEG